MTDSNNVMNEIQLVVFDLASEHYGVDISDVREIMRMQNITKVPGALVCVEGVLNLRGKVLPVLDLRKRLGLKVTEHTEDSRIVIVDIEAGQVGVIVDAVTEVLRVENSYIDPPSSMVSHGNADYLKGIAKLSDRLIILLDLDKLLSQQAMGDFIDKAMNADIPAEAASPKRNGNGNRKKTAEQPDKSTAQEYATV
ncbi:MAG: purine-binding chemotaxis protein CheW [Dehalococcoidia bacterium]|nr:purine-binding chemotaxis protein CheW [Dehalococcoidia bacterium]